MKTAIVALSAQGAKAAAQLAAAMPGSDVFVHASAAGAAAPSARPFERIAELTAELFATYRRLVYIVPVGVAVRAIGPCISHKLTDPAVVAVDVGARWAISLLSGHEGGANDLAMAVGNILAAEPVITTTSEAVKKIIVGVGCRKGVSAETIVTAIREALALAAVAVEQVRLLASADIKRDEPGLLEAAARLGLPLRLVSSGEIRQTARTFGRSRFVQAKVRLPAVAEPAALLAGRRTRLLAPKKTFRRCVTVALAEEDCTSLE